MILKQAIRPTRGEKVSSKYMHALAEAVNSRIENGAGDSHWRIPYYIFSAYFRKPRLDDGTSYAPETEFFDFYQFVNPENDDVWPIEPPQMAEGANLQTNNLNKFIFGMNYVVKDDDGYWVFEREDVRVRQGQINLKSSPTNFRGVVFPFFTSFSAISAGGEEYTAFGLAKEYLFTGYINGNTYNPSGHSYGGYYGTIPEIKNGSGCGFTENGIALPQSEATFYRVGLPLSETYKINDLCSQGVGATNAPNVYSYLLFLDEHYGHLRYTNNQPRVEALLDRNKYHLKQFNSNVYLGRESKNHLYRLLYNYITYARNFDFDWFFTHQYAYAPEIGSFASATAYVDEYNNFLGLKDVNINPEKINFKLSSVTNSTNSYLNIEANNATTFQTGCELKKVRLSKNYKLKTINSDFLAADKEYKVLDGSILHASEIYTKGGEKFTGQGDVYTVLEEPGTVAEYISDNQQIETVTNVSTIKDYFYENGLLAIAPSDLPENLFSFASNTLDIPKGFTLYSFSIKTQNLKSFTIVIEVYAKNNNSLLISKDIYFQDSEAETLTSRVLQGFLAGDFSVKFKIKDCILINTGSSASVSFLTPVFLFSYKPKIEDAYALIRACTYWGDNEDAKIGNSNHPLNSANIFSNDLKTIGVISSNNIQPLQGNEPDRKSTNLNNNAFFETARRLSLFTRILGGHNFVEVVDNKEGNTLKFLRYSKQQYRFGMSSQYKDFYTQSSTAKIPFSYSNPLSLRTLSQSQNAIVLPNGFEMNTSSSCQPPASESCELGYIGFIKDALNPAENDILNTEANREYLTTYYTSAKIYDFTKEGDSFQSKLDLDLIRTYDEQGETPIFSNKVDFSFSTSAFYVDYDSLIINPNNVNYYIYIRFEDKFGDPINNSSSAKSYKKYIVNNGVCTSGTTALTGEVANISENDLISISINGQTPVKPYIYVFSRVLNLERIKDSLGNLAKDFGTKGFFASKKDGSLVQMPIKNLLDTDDRKKPFYTGNLFSVPVDLEAWIKNNQEPEREQKTALIHNLDSSSSFRGNSTLIQLTDNSFPIVGIDSMYSAGAACSIVNESISHNPSDINNLPAAYQEIKFRLNTNNTDEVELISLYNLLYLNYGNFDILPEKNNQTDSIDWIYKSPNADLTQEKSLSFYNNNIAGYKIKFYNHEIGLLDTMDQYQARQTRIKIDRKFEIQVFDSSDNGRGTPVFFNLEDFVALPSLTDSTDYIKVKIPINSYKSEPQFSEDIVSGTSLLANTQYYVKGGKILFLGVEYGNEQGDKFYFQTEASGGDYTVVSGTPSVVKLNRLNDTYYNFNIFLAVNYYSFISDILPFCSSINREGSLSIERTLKVFDNNSNISSSLLRDMFQGIALDPDDVNNVDKNGIISIAESGFTNEWVLWMNFIPFNASSTSPFKQEVYALTGSPFYDRCHINSALIPNSSENLHLNLGLELARYVEAPPSYRYMPLLVKGLISYENSIGQSDDSYIEGIKNSFYQSCKAICKPYKIKKVYFKSGDLQHVYVELDRPLDGFGQKVDYRNDYNGLIDWLSRGSGDGNVNFKIGDASLTHTDGVNQSFSANSNQYKGSYYPRFFFLKLIPKPKLDNNSEYDIDDAPLSHEPLKQVELYLNAMREGFVGSDTSFPKLGCQYMRGHITPPDYTYEQLIHDSNNYVDLEGKITAGNMWPPLITFSPAYNTFQPEKLLLGPLRFEDNPRGFGAIPLVKTYGEYFDCLVNSINRLVSFRVGVPQKFIVTATSCSNSESQNGNENNWYTPLNNANFSQGQYAKYTIGRGYLAKFNSPTSVNPTNCVTDVFDLRNNDGTLNPISSNMGYGVAGPDSSTNVSISNAYIIKTKLTSSVSVKEIDPKLLNYAFDGIKGYIQNVTQFPMGVSKNSTGSKFESKTPISNIDGCGVFYKDSSNNYYIIAGDTKNYPFECYIKNNITLLPPPLIQGTPFFNIVSNKPCVTPGIIEISEGTEGSVPYTLSSFDAASSVSAQVYETGWRIATATTELTNVNQND